MTNDKHKQEERRQVVADPGQQYEPWTASRTFWTRLEPRTRDTNLDRVLRAEVHDPAWMLCRQWQVGEFQGEDAGSPVDAELHWERDRMSRFRLGPAPEIEKGPKEPVTPFAGSRGPSMDKEIKRLSELVGELNDHREEQSRGDGKSGPAVRAFETYLDPSAGGAGSPTVVSNRRPQLQYLTASLLSHPSKSNKVSFFERANHYLGKQPSSERTVGKVSIDQLVTELKDFVTGSGGSQTPVATLRVLLVKGTEAITRHLMESFRFALNAANAYKKQQTSGSKSGGKTNPPQDYDGEPLEVLVEREAVTTALDSDERPPARVRAEAGQQFLRFLAESEYTDGNSPYTAEDFADPQAADLGRFVLSEPDEPLDAADRRFTMVTDGRALDGHEVYQALATNVQDITSETPTWPGNSQNLPLPQTDSVTPEYKEGAKQFAAWYAGLYDEPSGDEGDAWDPDRLEYRFQVATGPKDGETAFSSAEYPGGSLDWYSFTHQPNLSLEPDADTSLTTSGHDRVVPSRVEYPGMPVPRWWEFEDAAVSLDDIPAGPEELSKLLLLDFSLIHSNDWFLVPMETPIGTLTRFTEVTVTDNFGETTSIDAVDDPNWNTFMYHDLDAAEDDEPGLLLPPTLGDTLESDPVERVYFSRDEMANMAFAVEERVESYVGEPQEREEFREPSLEIQTLTAGPGIDLDDEKVVLHNPGDAPLELDGWELEATVGTGTNKTESTFFDFSADASTTVEIPPGETVTIHSGTQPPGRTDDDENLYAGNSSPVWDKQQGAVTVLRPKAEVKHLPPNKRTQARFVTKKPLAAPDPSLPDYRLATSVPDHWFPLKPVRPKPGNTAAPADSDSYRLALSLLLDADSMGDPLHRIPTPKGRILNTPEPLRLYEEEVTRAGREVERQYQLARWTDGSTHLWSSRRTSTGRGEAASRLRYDVLSEPDTE